MSTGKIVKGPGREIDPSLFRKDGTVLLESIRKDDENIYSYFFKDPVAVIQCTSSRMVESSIEQIEDITRKGMYAAGFIGYEAGNTWTPKCPDIVSSGFPLLWFGLYTKVERFESPLILPASDHTDEQIDHSLDVSKDEYQGCVRKILQLICDGETYQVNYTARTRFHWEYGAWQLYLRLRRSQPVPYGAFMNCGRFNVISLSPELFLTKSGKMLQTRPMKGTAPRGTDQDSDEQNMKWLGSDPKNMAENRMIVDLMRNDLGKLAEIGKIQVNEPFRVEPYSGLFQMTSGVRCVMRGGVSIAELLKATFPPGSITGAPKIMLWFDEHLDRMGSSALQLGYPFSREKAKAAMSCHLGEHATGPAIVRLILTRIGDISVEMLPLKNISMGPKSVILSRFKTDPADGLLRHKTTFRDQYELELTKARKLGYVETLFTNINGNLTEGSYTNLFVLGSSGWITPGIWGGLLPGIWRKKFMKSSGAIPTTLRVGELSSAESIVIGNSVRGAMEVDEVVDADGRSLYTKPVNVSENPED
jgi:branched-subunit amino acid aminotransferase/4-amino-4-deoxychorismate lyase